MSLSEYSRKRDFNRTPEPAPRNVTYAGKRFFVQRHNASRLHYDLRLEIGGVLKSWAVPKGPSLDPEVKHFAAEVEDHPVDYGDFEGNIPKGEYGGGSVMLWDRGTYELIGEESAEAQIARGDLKFRLHGEKLHGTWAIVFMKGRGKGNEWLLIKKKDEAAETPFEVEALAWSVKTGRTQDEIAANAPAGAPMPDFFAPMGATITDKLPKGDNWICEVKWDGIRALVYIDRGTLRIFTRNNNRCEEKYPELRPLPKHLKARQAILDGEIVVLDDKGVSKFELTMRREKPAHFFAFDLLYLDGRDLRSEPLHERRKLLEQVVKPFPRLRISQSFPPSDELVETAKQTGLEGLVAKKADSKYESRRSVNWLKLKLTNEEEFVIAGYTPGERDYFGSLAVGFYEGDDLVYCGNVGTGFDEKTLASLWKLLEPLKTAKRPFAKADKIPKGTLWVQPELVAQVRFANWTSDRKLRAPVYLGLRDDKPADEVIAQVDKPGKFTNLTKIYYPEDGITKGDLIQYYDTVAPLLLPHLKDRPLSLKRYPNGIHGEWFFQKNTPESYPDWLRTETIDKIRYVLADDKRSLLYLVNLGCIDQNPWMSRVGSLENPDFILIDLDPQECGYDKIVEAALLVKEKLDAIGLKGYPKTTGGDGMHIYIPMKPGYTYAMARQFAEVISMLLAAQRPDLFTTPRSVEKREKNKVYFDWMQIAESKTISAPYVARAYKGAPVSTPLAWDEVKPGLTPGQFTIRNAPERFARMGDLFADVLRKPQGLEKPFGKLEKLIRSA